MSYRDPYPFNSNDYADSQKEYDPDPGPMIEPGALYRPSNDSEDIFVQKCSLNWDETPFESKNNEQLPFEPEYEQNQYLFEFISQMYFDSRDQGDDIKADMGVESNLDQRVQEAYEEIRSPLRDSLAEEEDFWTRLIPDPLFPQDL